MDKENNNLSPQIYAVLGFFLNGRLLPNNSIVLLREIGEGSSALLCLTDRVQCCSYAEGRLGLWRSPDGDVQQDTSAGIYTIRGFSSLLLNRKSSTMMPTGVYTCLIPSSSDDEGTSHTLCIGIYSSSAEG